MDSRTGKLINHGRLFDPTSGRTIVVAASHGVLRGPLPGLATAEEITTTLGSVAAADAIMLSPGMLPQFERHVVGRDRPELVIEVDWKNSGRGRYEPTGSQVTSAQIASIEACAAAGAVAVMTFLYVGQDDVCLERAEIERNAALAEACDRFGLLCIIEPRSAQERVDSATAASVEVVSWYCRLAAELGADAVKCVWPGDADVFAAAVAGATAPVLLAGGADGGDLRSTLTLFRDAVDAGARGVMAGRRVYTSGDPAKAMAAIRAVVHAGAGVDEALAGAGL
ncbi:MAG: class I fructose-bisphosphate aldolase [Propioniciclava sp.]